MQPPPFRELQDLTASERKLTLSERADPPPSGEEEDQLILTDLSIVTEMLQVVACPHCKQHRLSMHAGRVMGYAVEMALSCDSCGKQLDRRFSSRKMATDPNITRQPFRVNRRAVLAAKEGGFCQTGLTRVTAIMNIRGGLHHKTFAAIANSIQRQLYGVAADTLAESRRTVHRAISLSVQHQHLFYTFLTLYNSDIVFKNITGRFYNALPLYIIQDCCLQPGAQ